MKSLRIRKVLKTMGYKSHNKFKSTYYYKDGLELSPTTIKGLYESDLTNFGREKAQVKLLNWH